MEPYPPDERGIVVSAYLIGVWLSASYKLGYRLNLVQEENDFVLKIILCDETNFHLSGKVNAQTLAFRAIGNLHEMQEEPLLPLILSL